MARAAGQHTPKRSPQSGCGSQKTEPSLWTLLKDFYQRLRAHLDPGEAVQRLLTLLRQWPSMPVTIRYVNSGREEYPSPESWEDESLSIGIDPATGADFLEIHNIPYSHPAQSEYDGPAEFLVPVANVERELERLSSTAAASRPRAAKGPVRGEIDRFGDADRALFPEIERLMQSQHLTSTEAVQQIPEDKLAGRGTLDSRIRRVSDRFRREKL